MHACLRAEFEMIVASDMPDCVLWIGGLAYGGDEVLLLFQGLRKSFDFSGIEVQNVSWLCEMPLERLVQLMVSEAPNRGLVFLPCDVSVGLVTIPPAQQTTKKCNQQISL